MYKREERRKTGEKLRTASVYVWRGQCKQKGEQKGRSRMMRRKTITLILHSPVTHTDTGCRMIAFLITPSIVLAIL